MYIDLLLCLIVYIYLNSYNQLRFNSILGKNLSFV